MRRVVCRLVGVAAFVGLAVGCSSEPPLAQLSGTVKFTGEPVPAGYISFTPEVAAGGQGQVRVVQIRNGAFDSSKEPTPGIFPGPCVVRIAGFDGKGREHHTGAVYLDGRELTAAELDELGEKIDQARREGR